MPVTPLGLMGICCRPPGGDGQKRPSRDLGKSGCLSQLGEDWVTMGRDLASYYARTPDILLS